MKLIDIDFSEIEARMLAHMEPVGDLHLEKAVEVFKVPPVEITREQRLFAKRLNYFEIYGGKLEL